ncbi:hypothetical protein [Bacillus sp. NPDC057893]|uniref:hypothetical protein n=1 Tax=Bacillus sp. NPDC057893 TaxID=3346273 RepID=UPI00366EA35F
MDIKYDKYELLEIFEDEPEDYYISGAGVYKYSKTDSLGFRLLMYMSVYENTVELNLLLKEKSIFDTNIVSVERVYTREDTLYIQCSGENKIIQIKFKPYFTVTINEF